MKKIKWKIIAFVFAVILTVATAFAGDQTTLYEKITVTTGSAVTLTTPPDGCKEALIICETNDVRFRRDGTAPTSTTGMLLEAGQNIVLEGYKDIAAFQAIAVSATGYLSTEYRVGY